MLVPGYFQDVEVSALLGEILGYLSKQTSNRVLPAHYTYGRIHEHRIISKERNELGIVSAILYGPKLFNCRLCACR